MQLKSLCFIIVFLTVFLAMPLLGIQSEQNTEDVLITVGDEVITRKEFNDFFKNYAKESNLSQETFTRTMKENILQQIIDYKILYQEAIKNNWHYKNPKINRMIRQRYLESRIDHAVAQTPIDDTTLKNYYDSHLAEYSIPPQVLAKWISYFSYEKTDQELEQLREQVFKDPQSITNWQGPVWIATCEDATFFFSAGDCALITQLRKNEISPVMRDVHRKAFIFWGMDYQASHVKSFEKARDDIKNIIQQEARRRAQRPFVEMLEADKNTGESYEKDLWNLAMAANIHRSPEMQQTIVDSYVLDQNSNFQRLADTARSNYKIEKMSTLEELLEEPDDFNPYEEPIMTHDGIPLYMPLSLPSGGGLPCISRGEFNSIYDTAVKQGRINNQKEEDAKKVRFCS